MKNARLSLKIKVGYGIADLGGNLFLTAMMFWMLYYLTDILKLDPALAGIALMLSRVWDAVTDPAIGYLSDNTKSRWGRRRPYIFTGAILLFIASVLMFTPPAVNEQTLLFVWVTIAYCFLNTAYTAVNIPYSALTPEITDDYNERTELNAYRMSFAVVGTLIGAALTPLIIKKFSLLPWNNVQSEANGFFVMGILYGLIMMTTALITVFTVQEKQKTAIKKKKEKVFASYLSAIKFKPFILIFIPWIGSMTAMALLTQTLKYFFLWVYKTDSGEETIAMAALLVTTMIFIPLWAIASKRLEKKTIYAIGMTIMASAILAFFFLSGLFPVSFSYIIMTIVGIGLATTYVIPWSIVPDVIEYDYLITKERREGVFYGLWTFVTKVGHALAGLLGGLMLKASNYDQSLRERFPDINLSELAQPKEAIFSIKLLFGPIPATIYLLSALVLMFYPITRKKYNIILKDIEKMESELKK